MASLRIAIPGTKHDYFDYTLPEGMAKPVPGTRVLVPFRNKTRVGIVLEQAAPLAGIALKPIEHIIEAEPIFSEAMLSFYQWLARYYHAPLSDVLTLALPKRYREGKPLIEPSEALPKANASMPLPLNQEQRQAYEHIVQALEHYDAFVLDGVTGSGKTEVYLQVAAKVIEQQRQVLVLVPEIGLTPQLIARFEARFQVPIAVIHSHLTDKKRAEAFTQAKLGKASLVIGTRAALFTPMPRLGLIIIDEEHDTSFKQQEGMRYSARDAALMRAYLAKVPIVLGSATPSLESLYNCDIKKHKHLILNQKAENQTPLHFKLVDMRAQKLQFGLAKPTIDAIEAHLKQKRQVLIFINRRGYAPVMLCHGCGTMADCKHCDSHLTLHQHKAKLICHHCGIAKPIPKVCPECKEGELIAVGAGTERIEEELMTRFPEATTLRMDRDKIKQSKAWTEALDRIHSGEAELLVGTQMLAKGHHFPNLSLVVILNIDTGFFSQDFRALERLGQLITQVSGRAGRADAPGEVILQTHFPDHPLLNTLIQEGYQSFTQALLPLRKEALWPPYHHMALLRAQAKNEGALQSFLITVKRRLQTLQLEIEVLGPAFAPLARKATQYHMQLLIKAKQRQALHRALSDIQMQFPPYERKKGVRWVMDVDPVDLA